jgi:hypothetical protein
MMVAVALAGLLLSLPGWLHRRSTELFALCLEHGRLAISLHMEASKLTDGPGKDQLLTRLRRQRVWHVSMFEKYEFAYNHPFLPIAPDPPEPE